MTSLWTVHGVCIVRVLMPPILDLQFSYHPHDRCSLIKRRAMKWGVIVENGKWNIVKGDFPQKCLMVWCDIAEGRPTALMLMALLVHFCLNELR